MSVYCLSRFSAQQIALYKKSMPTESMKILLCGDSSSILECIDFFQELLGDDFLNNVLVATDDIAAITNKYSNHNQMKTIYWNGNDETLNRAVNIEKYPIRVVIDLKPTLRRLHRISAVIPKNSLIIIKEEGNSWRSIFPALFASFIERGTQLINFEDIMATGQVAAQMVDESFEALEKLRI